MNERTDSFGVRAKRTLTRLVVVVVIVGLAGAAGVLLSRLNARTFSLEHEGGALVVMKGRPLPMGTEPYRPTDPALADAYAPLPLEGMPVPPALLEERFGDRDELDRALFALLERLATPRLEGEDPAELERGLYFVRRAQRLSGLTEEQRKTLDRMQAEVAFHIARNQLEDARKQVAEALTQLRLAADARGKNARAAHQMISAVEPAARQLEEALRRAVHSLAAPVSDATEPMDAKPQQPANPPANEAPPQPTPSPAAEEPAP